jgi:hypothetical protein
MSTHAGRAQLALERAAPTGELLNGSTEPQRARLPQTRFHPAHANKALQSFMKSPDGL